MKLFTVKANGNYCAGMVIVIAEDIDSAKSLANTSGGSSWNIDYKNKGSVSVLDAVVSGEERVLECFEFGE